jgi:uncharacterized protein (DUF427 family)
MKDAMMQHLADLRHEPTEKRVRAKIGDRTVVDSTRAMLVWEPRRIVPSYAVPVDDIQADLVPEGPAPSAAEPAVLHPGIAFTAHSTVGESFAVRTDAESRDGAAFRPADIDLAEYAILDFNAFDAWFEEDDELFGHPRDPYSRIDIRPSSRHVRVEIDGQLVAESTRPTLLFETGLPVRFYLPKEDVRGLEPSDRRTYCAYKGQASYWSIGEHRNYAWTYTDPLPGATEIADLVAFYDEMVDITVDGVRRPRPHTAVSKAVLDESGMSEPS